MGGTSLADKVRGVVASIFNSKSDRVPPSILSPNGNHIHIDGGETAVNFNYILKTGDATASSNPYNNKQLNLNGNDSYARAQRAINADTIRRIQQDPKCETLLQKKSWTRDDRILWEQQIAFHAAQSRCAIPGLADYRTDTKDKPLKHTNSPNADLSPDIDAARKNPTAKPSAELDCKEMSLIEGMAIQNAENHFLKGPQGGSNDLKTPGSYFYMPGETSGKPKEVDGHAFIYTPSGNIVEATQPPSGGPKSVYRQALVPHAWDAIFRGKKVETSTYSSALRHPVYGGDDSVQAYDAARQTQERQAQKNWIPNLVHRVLVPAL
jgi:hypothetical protein